MIRALNFFKKSDNSSFPQNETCDGSDAVDFSNRKTVVDELSLSSSEHLQSSDQFCMSDSLVQVLIQCCLFLCSGTLRRAYHILAYYCIVLIFPG